MNENEFDEFDEFMKTYYRSESDPDRTAKAVRFFIASSNFEQIKNVPGSLDVVQIFCARIGIDEPSVLRVYERVFDEVAHEQRVFLLGVLSRAGDNTTKIFLQERAENDDFLAERHELECVVASGVPNGLPDPLLGTVTTGMDLDRLWVEFWVSGNDKAIRRIVQVLEWPDQIRDELERWLRSEWSGLLRFFLGRRDRIARKLDNSLGISVDISRREIETPEDLDCLCSMENGNWSQERLRNAIEILPFVLNSEQIETITTKAAAKWSLAANAISDDLVRSICEEEAATRVGPSQIALLELLTDVCRSLGQHKEAARFLQKYVQLHPKGMRRFTEF